jgi:thioredoxin 2
MPAGRLAESPGCGKCHRPLFAGTPVELAEEAFEKQVAGDDLPVLVDFWAPRCAPSRAMASQFVEAARLLEPGVRLAKVNTDVEQRLAERHAIRSIPTLALFRGGREVARQAGAMGAQHIVRWVRGQLG